MSIQKGKMYSKFKNGERVIVLGVGKMFNKFYYKSKGKVINRDPYFKDYCVKIDKGINDWFDEECLHKMRQRGKKNEGK